MLQIKDLSKSFSSTGGSIALDSVTFDVNDGEIVGFVGLNGAGKTTTVRIAAGVALPNAGTVSVDGHDIVTDKVEASRRIGWVPEFPTFEMGARALSLMVYFCGYYGIDSRMARKRSLELLDLVGLSGFEERKLRTYSQGMKKRFSLAAAMISDPQNYLFDEILNGLDPEGVHFVRNLIAIDFRKSGKAVLLSSHILAEVENVADRVVLVHRGKIVRTLTRQEVRQGKSSLEDLFFETIRETV